MSTRDAPALYHFTSAANAAAIDRDGGWVQPGNTMLARRGWDPFTEGGRYVWLISEPYPTARLLGFSDATGYMAARFRVVDPSVATWWPARRREHSRAYLANLEAYALPTLWWVVEGPVQVVRDLDWQDPSPWRGVRHHGR